MIENEIHSILNCHVYDDLRINLLGKALEIVPHLNSLSDEQKLVVLFSDPELVRICAKTCAMILQRRHFLNSNDVLQILFVWQRQFNDFCCCEFVYMYSLANTHVILSKR